jgi:hypothetical protein
MHCSVVTAAAAPAAVFARSVWCSCNYQVAAQCDSPVHNLIRFQVLVLLQQQLPLVPLLTAPVTRPRSAMLLLLNCNYRLHAVAVASEGSVTGAASTRRCLHSSSQTFMLAVTGVRSAAAALNAGNIFNSSVGLDCFEVQEIYRRLLLAAAAAAAGISSTGVDSITCTLGPQPCCGCHR